MSHLTLLNLDRPKITADYESNAPTGISLNDIQGMEQFLIGLRTHTGQTITPAKAMRASAVLACMRIISEDLSALKLKLYKRTPNGPEEAHDHPLYRLLDIAPNDVMTSIELREHIIFDLMLAGNFYVLKNGDTELESLWPLQAVYVTRRWRELVWVFTDPVTGVSGTFTPDLVWRGTIMAANGLDGQALTLLAREAIGLLLAAEEQGARLFSHGVQSDLTLQTDEEMDKEGREQLKDSLMRRHAGSNNAWMPLLLENGLKAARIGLTAQESQYIEARKFQIEDIARIFRVPEVLLGNSTSGKSSTYASAEQFFLSYTKHTLTPWAERIEQTINRDLLSKKDQKKYFARHDFSSLLRGDTAARAAYYTAGINAGWFSPAEARREEGKPYVAGLDYYLKVGGGDPEGADGGGDEADPIPPIPPVKEAPTDESGKNELPRRVALSILRREQKYLTGRYANDPKAFYERHASHVEDLTGADLDSVLTYCGMRIATADKFSTESKDKAIAVLISLCQKDA